MAYEKCDTFLSNTPRNTNMCVYLLQEHVMDKMQHYYAEMHETINKFLKRVQCQKTFGCPAVYKNKIEAKQVLDIQYYKYINFHV